MLKTRAKKAEEEAKLEENYRPTKELEAEEEKPTYQIPWTGVIVVGVLLVLVAICIILIYVFGGPRA